MAASSESPPGLAWHAFLSHIQKSGGPQALILREALASRGVVAWCDADELPTKAGMASGVNGSTVFVSLLTPGVYTSQWVLHEVFLAVAAKKPIVLVHDASSCSSLPGSSGSPEVDISALLAEGADAISTAAKEKGMPPEAAMASILGAAVVPYMSSPELFQEATLAPLMEALRAAAAHYPADWPPPLPLPPAGALLPRAPFRLAPAAAALAHRAHPLDVLLTSGRAGLRQLHFLQLGLQRLCPSLRVAIRGPAGAGHDTSLGDATADDSARLVVAFLTCDVWSSEEASCAMLATLRGDARSARTSLQLLYEQDSRFGGTSVFELRETAYQSDGAVGERARRVLAAGLFEDHVALPFERQRAKRELMLEALLKQAGALPSADAGPFATPPLPPFYCADVTAEEKELVSEALLQAGPHAPRVVAMGGEAGLGKTSLAVAVARDPRVQSAMGGPGSVLWLSVGMGASPLALRELLTCLLEELCAEFGAERTKSAAELQDAPLEAVSAAVHAAVRSLSGRVLLVADDCTPAQVPVLAACIDPAGPARLLLTTRSPEECAAQAEVILLPSPAASAAGGGAAAVPESGGAVAVVLRRLSVPRSLRLLQESASVAELCLPPHALEPLVNATEGLPLTLQLVAGALRALIERPNRSGIPDSAHATAAALALTLRLGAAAAPGPSSEGTAGSSTRGVHSAIGAVLAEAFSPTDAAKLCSLALFPEDAEVPIGLLAAAWRMAASAADFARCCTLVDALAAAALVKKSRTGSVQLHDLVRDFALAQIRSIAAEGPGQEHHGGVAAPDPSFGLAGASSRERLLSNLLDRAAAAFLPAPSDGSCAAPWWELGGVPGLRPGLGLGLRPGTPLPDATTCTFLGAHLLALLRDAGRGAEASSLLLRLEWLLHTLTTRGVHALQADLTAHLQWVRAREAEAGGAPEEARTASPALSALLQLVRLSAPSLQGPFAATMLVVQLAARLGEHVEAAPAPARAGLSRIAAACASLLAGRYLRGMWRVAPGVLSGADDPCVGVLSTRCTGLCARADGRLLVSSGWPTRSLALWDLESGACLWERSRASHDAKHSLTCLAALPDRRRVVTGTDHHGLLVWDYESGAFAGAVGMQESSRMVRRLAVLPDGRVVAEVDDELTGRGRVSSLLVWDLGAPDAPQHTIPEVAYPVLLPRGRLLARTSSGQLGVWSTDSFAQTSLWKREGDPGTPIGSVPARTGDDTALVALALESGDVTLVDIDRREVAVVLSGHTKPATAVQLLRGDTLATASADRSVRVWKAGLPSAEGPVRAECLRVLAGHTEAVQVLALTAGGLLASGSWDLTGAVRLWDPRREPTRPLREKRQGEPVRVLLPVDAHHILSGAADGVRLWDVRTGRCLRELGAPKLDVFTLTLLSPSLLLAVTSRVRDKFAVLFDLSDAQEDTPAEGSPVLEPSDIIPLGGAYLVGGVAVTPAGRVFLGLNKGLGELALAASAFVLVEEGSVERLAALPDGRLAVYGGELLLRDPDAPAAAALRLSGHTEPVISLLPLPEERLLTSSYDDSIRMWSTGSGECLRVFVARASVGHLRDLRLLANGAVLVHSCYTGGLPSDDTVWSLDTARGAFTQLDARDFGVEALTPAIVQALRDPRNPCPGAPVPWLDSEVRALALHPTPAGLLLACGTVGGDVLILQAPHE